MAPARASAGGFSKEVACLAEFFELGAEDVVGFLGEAGAGASGVDEFAVAIVAEEQRADAVDAVGLWRGG